MLNSTKYKSRLMFVSTVTLLASSLVFANEAIAANHTSGTYLVVANSTDSPIRVMITLGAGHDISSINQLPKSWGVTQGPAALLGSFTLAAHSKTAPFNSGSQSFSGNISFGPSWTATGCGGTTIPGSNGTLSCYPNATSLGEFSLNMGPSGQETVDISGVNGTNAIITMTLSGNGKWNDGAGGNTNVTSIKNKALPGFEMTSGVYGWAATNCTSSVNPPTNPPNTSMSNCPAPIDAPSAPQLQKVAKCNVQRAAGVTGGTVIVTFHGYTPGSTPPAHCAGS